MTAPRPPLEVHRAVQRLRCQRWLREAWAFMASGQATRGDRIVLSVIAAEMREAVRADLEELGP